MALTADDRKKMSNKVAHIKVIPLNMEAINVDIDKSIKEEIKKAGDSSLAPKVEADEYFVLRGKLAVVVGTNMLIDNECVGECIKDKAVLEIYSGKRDENGKLKSFGMFPRFTSKQTLEDLIKEFAMPKVSLEEFMGDRFNYNGRIACNITDIYQEHKKQVK